MIKQIWEFEKNHLYFHADLTDIEIFKNIKILNELIQELVKSIEFTKRIKMNNIHYY